MRLGCKAFRSTDFSSAPNIYGYLSEVERSFCPYVEPARRRECIIFSQYTLEDVDFGEAQDVLMLVSLFHTLLFLRARSELRGATHWLLTENLFVAVPEHFKRRGELIQLSHWLLRYLFTVERAIFGRFYEDEQSDRTLGVALPSPPTTVVLSIRSPILPGDEFFFRKTPALIPVLSGTASAGNEWTAVLESLDAEERSLLQSCLIDSLNRTGVLDFVQLGMDLGLVARIEKRAAASATISRQ